MSRLVFYLLVDATTVYEWDYSIYDLRRKRVKATEDLMFLRELNKNNVAYRCNVTIATCKFHPPGGKIYVTKSEAAYKPKGNAIEFEEENLALLVYSTAASVYCEEEAQKAKTKLRLARCTGHMIYDLIQNDKLVEYFIELGLRPRVAGDLDWRLRGAFERKTAWGWYV